MKRRAEFLVSVAVAVGLIRCANADPEELFVAINGGDAAKVGSLLEQGAEVNARDDRGRTPLMEALAGLRIERSIVDLLLTAGADVTAKADDGTTAISTAASYGHGEFVKELLSRGATDEGSVALVSAAGDCNFNQLEIVNLLLDAGADVDGRTSNGKTALLQTAWCGHSNLDIVRVLIAAGADVNAADQDGATALMYAANFGVLPLAKLLIDNGADVRMDAGGGRTALWVAKQQNQPEMVRLLQDAETKSPAVAEEGSGQTDLKPGVSELAPAQADSLAGIESHPKEALTADQFGKQLFETLRDQNYDSIEQYLWHEKDWGVLAKIGGKKPTQEKLKEIAEQSAERTREELREGIALYHERHFNLGTATYRGAPVRSVEYVRFVPRNPKRISQEYTQYNDSHLVIKINGVAEVPLEIDHIQVIKGVWRISEIR